MRSLPLFLAAASLLLAPLAAPARGVTPYLPLHLSPDIERQIERVLILGGKSVMRRPIPAALVLEALPAACRVDPVACQQVRRYIGGFMDASGVVTLRPELAILTGDSSAVLPNRHGRAADSSWALGAGAYYQPNDYLIVNAGLTGHDDNVTATGTFVSFGFDFAQVDLGFRDHWLSPLSDSSALIGTQAPTLPSVTLSNYQPLTRLGISYEVFFGEMSRQEGIFYQGSTTAGRPRLGGIQLGIEPVPGYALAVNRLVQYGGGARNTGLVSQFFEEMFEGGNRNDTVQGAQESNRVASLTSSLVFPGPLPFVARIDYAGEDNAFKGRYRLGATNLSFGLDFPMLFGAHDFTLEVSEWQNAWYVHPLYPAAGLTNRGRVLGHWFGDNRRFGEDVGGRSYLLRAGRRLQSGSYLQASYRNLDYDPDWVRFDRPRVSYRQMQMLAMEYSTSWRGHPVDAGLTLGRDVFGESFARLEAAFELVPAAARSGGPLLPATTEPSGTEFFVDIGAQRSRVRDIMLDIGPDVITGPSGDFHAAVGARRQVGNRHDVGVRLEIDQVAGDALLSLRAVDYRFRFSRRAAIGAFFGAARYDVELPAHGYYMGAGVQYLDLLPGWDLGFDFRLHEKLTRDKVLESDPPLTVQLPRRSLDINGMSLYLSRKW